MSSSIQRLIKPAILGLAIPVFAFAMLSGPSTSVGAAVDAAATYKAKCAACHGPDGSKALNIKGKSDDQIYAAIAHGVKPKMPGYEKTLGADTCRALVAYVKQLKK
jgi:mono/diheme cytochrome c family protein